MLMPCAGAADDAAPDLELTVHVGEMLWFPPGWAHEVVTLEGHIYDGTDDVLTINWVSWCLPKHLTNSAVMNMFAGVTAEDQCEVPSKRLTKPQQAKMSAIATAWVGQQ